VACLFDSTQDIDTGVVQVANGGQLTSALHRYGVNVRLLGLLWGLLQSHQAKVAC
jgi:hypothetical protein